MNGQAEGPAPSDGGWWADFLALVWDEPEHVGDGDPVARFICGPIRDDDGSEASL